MNKEKKRQLKGLRVSIAELEAYIEECRAEQANEVLQRNIERMKEHNYVNETLTRHDCIIQSVQYHTNTEGQVILRVELTGLPEGSKWNDELY